MLKKSMILIAALAGLALAAAPIPICEAAKAGGRT